MSIIGILHPGEMGISIAASALKTGHDVCWLSTGRSGKTRLRAEQMGLLEIEDLSGFCQACEIIVCICPPHAAEEVARQVIEGGFEGSYLDANAISPQRAETIGRRMKERQIHFVDGAIIGGPAWQPGETCLYLSGVNASKIADCFQNGPLETRIISDKVGKASALKMCYAAYSKGTTALLASILATAEALGVREELYRQWDRDDPVFSEQVHRRVIRASAKAWRFTGEMDEISSTFQKAGLPGGFHQAAAEIFRRMARPQTGAPNSVDEVLAAILPPIRES